MEKIGKEKNETQKMRSEAWKRRNLWAENSDGVLSTKSYQIRGTPRNVIHYSVATCSYKHPLYFNPSTINAVIRHCNLLLIGYRYRNSYDPSAFCQTSSNTTFKFQQLRSRRWFGKRKPWWRICGALSKV